MLDLSTQSTAAKSCGARRSKQDKKWLRIGAHFLALRLPIFTGLITKLSGLQHQQWFPKIHRLQF